jgi:uncharacterized protein YbjT (DUF2867 family)
MCYHYARNFEIENAVRQISLTYYTILRPSFLMHNYLQSLCMAHFPNYGVYIEYLKGRKTAHFDPYDIGKFAAAALLDPKRFSGHEIELGNE